MNLRSVSRTAGLLAGLASAGFIFCSQVAAYDNDTGSSMPQDCITSYLGDGDCDSRNNNELCGYDGGDCCVCTCQDGPDYECGDVGFSCIDPDAPCVDDEDGSSTVIIYHDYSSDTTVGRFYDDATVGFIYDDDTFGLFGDDDDFVGPDGCITSFISDNDCDPSNNNEACGYDGGDCCSCTCEDAPADFYQCGQSGFACVDPDALCNLESAASAVTTSSFVSGAALIIILGAVQAATAG